MTTLYTKIMDCQRATGDILQTLYEHRLVFVPVDCIIEPQTKGQCIVTRKFRLYDTDATPKDEYPDRMTGYIEWETVHVCPLDKIPHQQQVREGLLAIIHPLGTRGAEQSNGSKLDDVFPPPDAAPEYAETDIQRYFPRADDDKGNPPTEGMVRGLRAILHDLEQEDRRTDSSILKIALDAQDDGKLSFAQARAIMNAYGKKSIRK